MSADREVNRIVRSWLEEGVTALPDRVLDNVLDQLPATPQRRAPWPARRFHPMNAVRIAVAAAAVVVAAVVGINLMPGQGVGVGPSPSPSPSPTISLPAGTLAVPPADGALTPGRYLIGDPFPLDVSLTFGEGWTSWSGTTSEFAAFYKGSPDPPGGYGFGVLIVDNVNADACNQYEGELDPPIGPAPDDLAIALANQPMTDSSPITDVSIDGHAGRYVELSMNGVVEPGCVKGQSLVRWPGRDALLYEQDKIWIVDVDGVRLVIDAFSWPGNPESDHAEVQAIVDSIRIE